MSNNLDKKLEGLLLFESVEEGEYGFDESGFRLKEGAIDMLKQAFIDDGWRKIPKQADIQHLIDDGTTSPLETREEWERQAIKDGWVRESDIPTNEHLTEEGWCCACDADVAFAESTIRKDKGLMTGQEWYDKFEKEYMSEPIDLYAGYDERPEEWVTRIDRRIKEVAKKAAGIDG